MPRDSLQAMARLADPVRRRLYEHVVAQAAPVSREAAAKAVGIARSLAAYHLDKLAAEGLLSTVYARTGERTGPGAGRTSKLYRRSEAELAVSLPPRDYERAAELLAAALDNEPAAPARGSLWAGARRVGRDAVEAEAGGPDPLLEALTSAGYEPFAEDGEIRLRNCPFHHLAQRHRDLICGMNQSLVEGMLDGLPAESRQARLDPRPGCCCVVVGPRPGAPA